MKLYLTLALLALFVLLTGCADNAAFEVTDPNAHVYGFWGGIWHGWIVWWNALGSLFWDDVTVFAPSNTGFTYNLGFFLGATFFGGGVGFTVKQ